MTKEKYSNPKTLMIEKFHFFFVLNGGISLSFFDFEKLFNKWINIPIVKIQYPIERMQNKVVNTLNKHFEI